MEKIVKHVVENYLSKKIEHTWEVCSKTGIKIPYTVEEAGFNSLLLASIYDYIEKNEKGYSFPVSEAYIERSGTSRCRCDIIWYREADVYYFELKGSFYGNKDAETDINKAISKLKKAKEQLRGINYCENERWYYKYEDSDKSIQQRYGYCLAMIQSIIKKDGESNYNEIKKQLEKNDKIKIFYKHQFSKEKLAMMTDGDNTYRNDGYFIIGNVYDMENLK